MEIVKIKLYMYMKNIFQSLSIATLLGLFVPFISSCSDDEEVFNEWNATYVSLQRNDYLSGNVKKFNLTHDANGIGGDEIKMAFTVKTQKAVSTDMVIALSAKSETEGLDASQIVLSSSQVTLKEGQMKSLQRSIQRYSPVSWKKQVSLSVYQSVM
jgi:hypothetical protein